MTTVAWATDLHLDWADAAKRRDFFDAVQATAADAVVLSGDIAEGANTAGYLEDMAWEFQRPIYFVLGNHDFYGSSLDRMRRRITTLTAGSAWLHYLSAAGAMELAPRTAMIGHEGWGDARLGDYENSKVFLTDFVAIEDLAEVYRNRQALRQRLNELGDAAAQSIAACLTEALLHYPQVVLVTHVPPFREAAWHNGQSSDDDWLPFFSCQAVGETLRQIMRQHPQRQLLVLCGHTHGQGQAQILDNLRVLTGGSDCSGPTVQQVLSFD